MTTVVDSSVWIDQLGDRHTRQTAALEALTIGRERIVVPDLVLVEVLQGTRDKRDFDRTLLYLLSFDQILVGGPGIAIEAARNYGVLRGKGITIRKTIDTIIATRCIVDDVPLLYRDRDFDPFVEHLGLKSALDYYPGVN